VTRGDIDFELFQRGVVAAYRAAAE